jgi:hypothetical protein
MALGARLGAMRITLRALLALSIAAALRLGAADTEPGFVQLMDGKTFDGWKPAKDNASTWKIEDGAFITRGPMCHLFYVGDEKPFRNFELKVDVMTEPNANGGIYFHTKYQENGWPRQGFESQVNVSHSDWKKTGSLYDVVNVSHTFAGDREWWTQHIIVQGKKVTVKVNDKIVLEYTEPAGVPQNKDGARILGEGTFALQAHDPKSVIRYKNIRVKRLD